LGTRCGGLERFFGVFLLTVILIPFIVSCQGILTPEETNAIRLLEKYSPIAEKPLKPAPPAKVFVPGQEEAGIGLGPAAQPFDLDTTTDAPFGIYSP
jgi:hypothetical protein